MGCSESYIGDDAVRYSGGWCCEVDSGRVGV